MGLLNKVFLFAGVLLVCGAAWSQAPDYGVGRPATQAEIKAWDIVISPEGKELPPGRGTAKEGAAIYRTKCAAMPWSRWLFQESRTHSDSKQHAAFQRWRGEVSCAMRERQQHHGCEFALRDHHLGLH